jgi:hypothetical protein
MSESVEISAFVPFQLVDASAFIHCDPVIKLGSPAREICFLMIAVQTAQFNAVKITVADSLLYAMLINAIAGTLLGVCRQDQQGKDNS